MFVNKIGFSEHRDERTAGVVVLHIYTLICKNILVNENDFLFSINDKLNLIITALFAAVYLFLIIKIRMLARVGIPAYAVVVASAAFIAVTLCVDPQRILSAEFPYCYVRRQLRLFAAYSLPLFVSVSSMDSVDSLLKKLFDWAPVPFVFGAIGFLMSLFPHDYGVYMSYGNAVMLVAVILIFRYIYTRDIPSLVMFALSVVFVLISGSRGPLIPLFISFVYMLVVTSSNKKKLAVYMGIISAACAVVYCFREYVFTALEKLMANIGLTSRTLEMLAKGDIANDTGRIEIYEKLLEKLNCHPLTGLGAFGGESVVGLSHSLYLDIFANFGYIVGSVLIIALFVGIVVICIRDRKTSRAVLLLIFLIILLTRGLFDESFWGAKELWIIMALIIGKKSGETGAFEYSRPKLGSNTVWIDLPRKFFRR